ncbi:unnamed protein product [Polarella glacialis]|uniref:Poly(A) RNA polymerase mitochondrial-like central palm domain-containing protein n=1 Tax=Polarella glacialis TaxID=89957 RepID=A0A813KLH5_POLGL|nr:unnamed protein product [Polarella glacialis]
MSFSLDRSAPDLGDALRASLADIQPLREDAKRHAMCIQQLRLCLRPLGQGWHLRAFGSSANTFCTRGSDLDLTCFHDSVQDQDSHLATQELRYKLLPLLYHHPRFEIKEQIWSARVPIVKLIFDGITEVDLSCHNPQALQNTYLLKAYADLSPQVRNLVLAVKVWAKNEGVSGAPCGHLSSYSLTLMVLYFLQVQQGLEMPRIPTEAFSSYGTSPEVKRIQWTCAPPLAELVGRFFIFYAPGAEGGGFQWGSEVVSVRLGQRVQPRELAFQSLPGRLGQRLHIEDPFLLARNLNCVLTPENEQLLKAKLQQTATTICSGGIPAAFLHNKLLESHASYTESQSGKTDTATEVWPAQQKHAGIKKDLAVWLGQQKHAGIKKDLGDWGAAVKNLANHAGVSNEQGGWTSLEQAAGSQGGQFEDEVAWLVSEDAKAESISDSESTRSGSGSGRSSSTSPQQACNANASFDAWRSTYKRPEATGVNPSTAAVCTERVSAAKAWLDEASSFPSGKGSQKAWLDEASSFPWDPIGRQQVQFPLEAPLALLGARACEDGPQLTQAVNTLFLGFPAQSAPNTHRTALLLIWTTPLQSHGSVQGRFTFERKAVFRMVNHQLVVGVWLSRAEHVWAPTSSGCTASQRRSQKACNVYPAAAALGHPLDSVQDQDSHLATQELRYKLLPLLFHHPRFEIKEQIWSARVPIVKLIFDGITEVDLSCHNPQALQNTYLLKAYADLSPQVRNLVLAVKVWAKNEGVSGAPCGHLSSYSLTLMVLYFLQVQQGLEMPCIPTGAFSSYGASPEVKRIRWRCASPLAELVGRFFMFYAPGAEGGGFQWGSEVVSVRLGQRVQPRELAFQSLPGRLGQRLHIEDPFLLARNLNCVLTPENEQLLKAKLQQTATTICSGGIPAAFLHNTLLESHALHTESQSGKTDNKKHAGIKKDLAVWLGQQKHAGIKKDLGDWGAAVKNLANHAGVSNEQGGWTSLEQAAGSQGGQFEDEVAWLVSEDAKSESISDSESTRSGRSSSTSPQQACNANASFDAWRSTYKRPEATGVNPSSAAVCTERVSAAKAWLDEASSFPSARGSQKAWLDEASSFPWDPIGRQQVQFPLEAPLALLGARTALLLIWTTPLQSHGSVQGRFTFERKAVFRMVKDQLVVGVWLSRAEHVWAPTSSGYTASQRRSQKACNVYPAAAALGLGQCLQRLGQGWHLRAFGSSANTFCTRGSDLDLTCFHDSVQDQDSHLATQELRYKLLPLLYHHPRFEIKEQIWSARVPIVKLIFDGITEVDLSCHNPQALQNTYLLKAYADLSPQVRNLVLAVKVWAKNEGVSGAPCGHLSSYSLTLMVLYFLQVQQGLEMPCIPTRAFSSYGASPEVKRIRWRCASPLAELVGHFFMFYAPGAEGGGFQWGSEVISVRLGQRVQPRELAFQSLPGRLGQRLHIEDPFLLARNLNCVLTPENEQLLKAKLQQTATTICSGGIPAAFLHSKLLESHALYTESQSGKTDTATEVWPGQQKHAGIKKDLAVWLGQQKHAGIKKDLGDWGAAVKNLANHAGVSNEQGGWTSLEQAAGSQGGQFEDEVAWLVSEDAKAESISDSESTRSGSGSGRSSSTSPQQACNANASFDAWRSTYKRPEATGVNPSSAADCTERVSAAKAWLDEASSFPSAPSSQKAWLDEASSFPSVPSGRQQVQFPLEAPLALLGARLAKKGSQLTHFFRSQALNTLFLGFPAQSAPLNHRTALLLIWKTPLQSHGSVQGRFAFERKICFPDGEGSCCAPSAGPPDQTFKRRRETEIKHGRVAMYAVWGLEAIEYKYNGTPGNYGWKPITSNDPEVLKRKLNAEIANGRLAMLAVIGMFFQDGLTGSAWGDWALYTASPLRAFENETGVQPPVGFWDPLGLAASGNLSDFKRRREVELKHSRVAMFATMGYILPEYTRIPGYLSQYQGIKFADVPNGFAAISKVPSLGWFQIVLFAGLIETNVYNEEQNNEPGNYGAGFLGLRSVGIMNTGIKEPDLRKKKLNSELANGRLAMLAIIGMFFQDGLTGSAWGDWALYTASPLRAFENELGAQAPVGFFDPLGLSKDGDTYSFKRRRSVEIKHGRVCMLATMGYITPEVAGHWPGYLSFSEKVKFADIPNGLSAISKVPGLGWFQIIAYAAFCEINAGYDADINKRNEPGNMGWRPPLFSGSDPETRKRRLASELANGRLAMMAIVGMLFQDGLTGSAWGDWALYTDSPLRAFENELGAQAPVGFFDPLGLSKDGDAYSFKRRRSVEIKHGRVCMLATMGYITPEVAGHWPGYLSFSEKVKFADIPNGLSAISKVPGLGWFQIIAYAAFCEINAGYDADINKRNEPGNMGWRPPLFSGSDPETRKRRLASELANGRLAMMAIVGMLFQDGLTGSAWGDWALYTDSPLRAFENELGAQAPVGFFDPLGLSKDGDTYSFKRRRSVEIKHGRVCMLATMGYITPEVAGHWPGYLSFSEKVKFADIPNGLSAISKVPGLGWFQIIAYAAFCEINAGYDADINKRNEPGNMGWRPPLFSGSDPETRKRRLASELANGRLAMMAIVGMLFQDGLTGSAWGDWALYVDSPLR